VRFSVHGEILAKHIDSTGMHMQKPCAMLYFQSLHSILKNALIQCCSWFVSVMLTPTLLMVRLGREQHARQGVALVSCTPNLTPVLRSASPLYATASVEYYKVYLK